MTLYSQIDSNRRKTWLIVAVFIGMVALLGYLFGQVSGSGAAVLAWSLLFSGAMSFGSYYYSDKLVLAISGASLVKEEMSPQLYRLVENLCIGAGLPKPKIYLINDSAPNAFATGRDPQHASICVTTGLLEKLDKLELEGVLAHELSHVKNFDIRLMSLVAVLVGSVTLLADWFMRSLWWGGGRRRRDDGRGGNTGALIMLLAIIFALLSPLIAALVQLAISRRREFLADASGALITRYPEGLARALEKIAADREPLEAANKATAHLYIVNPLKGQEAVGWFASLFNTHPSVKERIARLRAM